MDSGRPIAKSVTYRGYKATHAALQRRQGGWFGAGLVVGALGGGAGSAARVIYAVLTGRGAMTG